MSRCSRQWKEVQNVEKCKALITVGFATVFQTALQYSKLDALQCLLPLKHIRLIQAIQLKLDNKSQTIIGLNHLKAGRSIAIHFSVCARPP